MNAVKSVFLMTLIMALFLVVGYAIGGKGGMTIAFIISLIMNFSAYWFSDKIVLKMYNAKEIQRNENPQLFVMAEGLAKRAGLPLPKLYMINNDAPNAFATGRNPQNAAVALTTGIVKLLSRDELAGVISHEFAHIKNRDILIGSIAATLVGTITYIAQMAGWAAMIGGYGRSDDRDNGSAISSLLLIILAPIAAMLLQMAISRSREYMADQTGATISQQPLALASALGKLSQYNSVRPMQNAKPSSAHLFIVNPLKGGGIFGLFSTHPPIEKRVSKLKEISMTASF